MLKDKRFLGRAIHRVVRPEVLMVSDYWTLYERGCAVKAKPAPRTANTADVMLVATALAESLDKPFHWAVGFLFGNT